MDVFVPRSVSYEENLLETNTNGLEMELQERVFKIIIFVNTLLITSPS